MEMLPEAGHPLRHRMKSNKRKQRHVHQTARPINRPERKPVESSASIVTPPSGRDLAVVVSAWFVLVVIIWLLAKQNLSVPGLYYDEAVFAGILAQRVAQIPDVHRLSGTRGMEIGAARGMNDVLALEIVEELVDRKPEADERQ